MTAQKDEFLANWRATYGEMFPGRNSDAMPVDDATLAMGLMLTRLIFSTLKTRVIEPAFAEGAERQPSARPRGRTGKTE